MSAFSGAGQAIATALPVFAGEEIGAWARREAS